VGVAHFHQHRGIGLGLEIPFNGKIPQFVWGSLICSHIFLLFGRAMSSAAASGYFFQHIPPAACKAGRGGYLFPGASVFISVYLC
jgi:hypothetical protein